MLRLKSIAKSTFRALTAPMLAAWRYQCQALAEKIIYRIRRAGLSKRRIHTDKSRGSDVSNARAGPVFTRVAARTVHPQAWVKALIKTQTATSILRALPLKMAIFI